MYVCMYVCTHTHTHEETSKKRKEERTTTPLLVTKAGTAIVTADTTNSSFMYPTAKRRVSIIRYTT